ncbi:helix-turn-helix domain-containing protein [Fulvivirga sp. M361]|uniref:AraC family transcriptional regulator n=1 Tax=Fulvivirga sp. M361 TaxID=2594266 RepID=UPI00117BC806|nr:AraC family transcriptional regulator [Fulvivirga sp. M361]TRX50244.1 helix-turn-helix domain-containing protein [Fulvivirga sp. M361]
MRSRQLKSGFKGEKMIVVPRGTTRKYSSHELVSNLYLTDIGFFPKALNHFRDRPLGCLEYILIYCLEGRGKIKTKNKKYKLEPNTFFIIEKDKPHQYASDGKDPWSIYWIHFKGINAAYLYKKFEKHNNSKPIFIPFHQNKVAEFEYLLDLFKMGYTDQIFEYSSMLLHKLLGSFIYYSIKSNDHNDRSRDDLAKQITEYLNSNIYNTLTMNDIISEFGKSSSTLFTIFKERTGYSIMYFFSLIKIQKACELMNLTTLSIKEISYQLDYQDPLYFSRVFKKFMGVSPREYKKSF